MTSIGNSVFKPSPSLVVPNMPRPYAMVTCTLGEGPYKDGEFNGSSLQKENSISGHNQIKRDISPTKPVWSTSFNFNLDPYAFLCPPAQISIFFIILRFQSTSVLHAILSMSRHSLFRLGHGDVPQAVCTPTRVETLHMLKLRVEAVACGCEHTLALTQQGVSYLGQY